MANQLVSRTRTTLYRMGGRSVTISSLLFFNCSRWFATRNKEGICQNDNDLRNIFQNGEIVHQNFLFFWDTRLNDFKKKKRDLFLGRETRFLEDCSSSSYLFTSLKVSKTRNVRCMQTNYITDDLALPLSFSFFLSCLLKASSRLKFTATYKQARRLVSVLLLLASPPPSAAQQGQFVPRLRRNNAVPECRGPSGNLTPGAFHPSWTPCLAYRRHTIRDSLKSR